MLLFRSKKRNVCVATFTLVRARVYWRKSIRQSGYVWVVCYWTVVKVINPLASINKPSTKILGVISTAICISTNVTVICYYVAYKIIPSPNVLHFSTSYVHVDDVSNWVGNHS